VMTVTTGSSWSLPTHASCTRSKRVTGRRWTALSPAWAAVLSRCCSRWRRRRPLPRPSSRVRTSIPSTPSAPSWSASPTSSPMPRRRPWPRTRRRATTHSSSMAASGSARPTSCTPSAPR